jgi:hypothetical protein
MLRGLGVQVLERNGADGGTRTRGLCRDSSKNDDGGSEEE